MLHETGSQRPAVSAAIPILILGDISAVGATNVVCLTTLYWTLWPGLHLSKVSHVIIVIFKVSPKVTAYPCSEILSLHSFKDSANVEVLSCRPTTTGSPVLRNLYCQAVLAISIAIVSPHQSTNVC
jgi:hypothetical protein